MIKIMIVEDDKLVRKNLINKLNWEKFGMKVVAEAKNGEKALEELKKANVDLMITDLAMPIMSGIDLIREVRKKYPNIFVVVLTLHQDFEYIQEVMRLGAIDYIAKVELDNNTMDSTLLRIKNRIEKESVKHSTTPTDIQSYPYATILLSNQSIEATIDLFHVLPENKVMKVNHEIVLLKTNQQEQSVVIDYILSKEHLLDLLLIIRVNKPITNWSSLKQKLIEQKNNLLFYELSNDTKIKVKEGNKLIFPSLDNSHYIGEFQSTLLSLEWINQKETLKHLLHDIKLRRISRNQLNELILLTLNETSRIYSNIIPNIRKKEHQYNFWDDIEKQMLYIQSEISTSLYSQSLSAEANQCILKAITIIDKNLNSILTANEIAKQVNMSRSYFSVCFKNITGHTFNEYIRLMRINKAKNYLTFTNLKVNIIAENVGYKDVKYFSKIFRQATGLLPTEYKKKFMKHSTTSSS